MTLELTDLRFSDLFSSNWALGCFFHFVKNFKTAIETRGLRAQYNGGADFSLQATMISALEFVPVEDLVRAFEDLSETCPNQELQPLFDWLEDNYIDRPHRRGVAVSSLYFPTRCGTCTGELFST